MFAPVVIDVKEVAVRVEKEAKGDLAARRAASRGRKISPGS